MSGGENLFIQGGVDHDRLLPALHKWYHEEQATVFDNPVDCPENITALFGCPVWGKQFISRFLRLCIPSLLAEGNLPALNTGILLVLHTDKAGVEPLQKGTKKLEKYGVKTEIRIIPEDILAMMPEGYLNKYWLLGTCQTFYLQYARRIGIGFHMLMPDHVYSQNYFHRVAVLSKTHDAILQSSISGDITHAEIDLKKYKKGQMLSISAKSLMDITFKYMHRQLAPVLMNSRDVMTDMPLSHFIIWVGKNSIRCYSPHTSVAWFSAKITAKAVPRLYSALDTQVPYYLEGVTPYIPTLEDDMAFAEFSDDTKHGAHDSVAFSEFCLRFWTATYFNDGHLKLLATANVFPTSERRFGYMEDADIELAMQAMCNAIRNSREEIMAIYNQVAA